ncbi:MAG: hypothetical protein JSV97_13285 [candidate division WOR-3 bacterium]|nr:MAG: hypothetical protein JSV97_13285 [candidate division WOR-3 bacterium]
MLKNRVFGCIIQLSRVMKHAPFLVVLVINMTWLGSAFAKTYSQLHGERAVLSAEIDVEPFFSEGTYDPGIPKPEGVLGYPLGSTPVHYDEVITYITTLSEASQRVQLRPYGETYEGRVLYYMIITSEENMARIDEIKTSIARLADPRKLRGERETSSLIAQTPAVAWLGYCIHGNELSSTDAALQLAYQLAAGTDSLTERLRDELVIIIDPLQNPDGRERSVSQMEQLAGVMPNLDHQSLQHGGFWPWGRGNHYLFDLNRDWFSVVHPETRGRVKAILEWNPQLFIDAHEMGSFNTYLFAPPNEPHNPNITSTTMKWWDIFARDQAHAFDKYGWSYYTRAWYEGWYPGFGSHWALYIGAIGILYEQAGVNGSLIKRPEGTILTFRETVHHHFVSSMANLTTAAARREELLQDFYREKKKAMQWQTSYSVRAFVFQPGKNAARAHRFIETLLLQGIEVQVAEQDFVANDLHDYWGRVLKEKRFPRGTFIVSLNQPMRPLIQTILEFDPRTPDSLLVEELRELEKNRHSRFYEVTAWSIPMAYNIDAYWTGKEIATKTQSITTTEIPDGTVIRPNPRYGYVFDYSSDNATRSLILFLQNDYKVRIAQQSFEIEGQAFPRGSVLLRKKENPKELNDFVSDVADKTGITIYGVNTALSDKGPDLGGEAFGLIELPRIGIFAGTPTDFASYGALWYLLDYEYRLDFSSLDITSIPWIDLDRYSILVLPQVWGGVEAYKRILGNFGTAKLRTWIEQGGTLIAIGTAAAFAADTSVGLSSVRLRRQVLDKLDEYREAVERERAAIKPVIDSKAVWGVPTIKKKPPEEERKYKTEEDADNDERARLFMPRGCILRADLDGEHWLTSGMNSKVPVILYTDIALMSKVPVQTAARLADEENIRLSGLLWPEARNRWAQTAYCTRESMGKGQIILFADDPFFRGYFHGSKRLFTNALLLGPGLGTRRTTPW